MTPEPRNKVTPLDHDHHFDRIAGALEQLTLLQDGSPAAAAIEDVINTVLKHAKALAQPIAPSPRAQVKITDWVHVAKMAGQHRIRYATNRCLEDFLTSLGFQGVQYGQLSGELVLDAANRYMTIQYGNGALGNPVDRGRILATIPGAVMDSETSATKRYITRALELSEGGEYPWWSGLATLLQSQLEQIVQLSLERDAAIVKARSVADITDGIGWVYFNPDSGYEYSTSHPIESGECPDADCIRASTTQEDTLDGGLQKEFLRRHAAENALKATDPTLATEAAEIIAPKFAGDRISQKYLRRYPNSKKTKAWADRMVHIETENGVWRVGAMGYTRQGMPEAWVLPFEDAVRRVAHCGPEKRAVFIAVR